jgi:glycosyltransferase involved in cell wall biosynthesis
MKFSVIIPLYNKAPYVAKAIGSVLSQTFGDHELIIMDDGSMDGSFDIALKAIESHGHCHLYRQQNKGVSVARNNAVALSQGEYLCFLDADDWWEPLFLEEMSKLIEEYPDAGIYGTNYTIVNETKRKTRVANVGVEQGFEKGYIDYCKVYAKTLAMPLWTGAVCMPRRVFDEMGGFPQGINLGEDFMLWIRVALKYKVAFLNKPLSYYNQDVDSANRGVGRLHNPQHHILWNLDFLSEYEKTNQDCKQLIDNLRTYGLLPYYLSKEYHDTAKEELAKVDWGRQSDKMRKQYERSLFSLRSEYRIRQLCSWGKQWLFRVLK